MPGYMLHMGATVICSHGGQAMPTMPNPRVKVSSQPIVTQPTMYTVAGCPFVTGGNPLPGNCLMDRRSRPRKSRRHPRAAAGQPGNHHAERCALECSGHPGSGERDVKFYEY